MLMATAVQDMHLSVRYFKAASGVLLVSGLHPFTCVIPWEGCASWRHFAPDRGAACCRLPGVRMQVYGANSVPACRPMLCVIQVDEAEGTWLQSTTGLP